MAIFKGLLYVKHGAVGTRSEGPIYYLQTRMGDFLLKYNNPPLHLPDFKLEFYCRKMVRVAGKIHQDKIIEVEYIHEICKPFIPISEGEGLEIAHDFIINCPTFQFDGIKGSLEHMGTMYSESPPYGWEFVFSFKCGHPGYGDDRGAQAAPTVITPHTSRIVVQDNKVISAIMDRKWDMIRQEFVEKIMKEM